MNRLLKHYSVDVDFPNVSGIEHLEMLQIRDKLALEEESLSVEEKKLLKEADQKLLKQAALFHAELGRFVDLAQRRRDQEIPPSRWWWYLDVVTELPLPEAEQVKAS